jgi:hypothetical protein
MHVGAVGNVQPPVFGSARHGRDAAQPDTANYDAISLMVGGFLTVMALLPVIVALAVTVWAATRPSRAEQKT